MLRDNFNRQINYLRLSITDRCNLSCRYCTNDGKLDESSHSKLLSYTELLRISHMAVNNGIEKIRITGGEPLLREGVVDFIAEMSQIKGLKELALTTNGVLLDQYASGLKHAGLNQVNISLDSLNTDVFKSITQVGSLVDVQRGIYAAEQIGLPLKINMVVMRGINDREIDDFVYLTVMKDISIRFIDYMPIGHDPNWKKLFVPATEIMQRLTKSFTFIPALYEPLSGPATNYRIKGAAGTVGIISPITGHSCQTCNRIRVSAIGQVRSCLFSNTPIDLKPSLRCTDNDLLEQIIRQSAAEKPASHGLRFNAGNGALFQMYNGG